MELLKARRYGHKVIKKIDRVCNQIEFAGSIRRGEPEVKDIEILAEIMDPVNPFLNELDRILKRLKDQDLISLEKNGKRYKKFWLLSKKNPENGAETELLFRLISVDLFLVHPPSQWGTQLLIRTGPESFSKWLVTVRKPKGFRFHKGHLELKTEAGWIVVNTPTEQSVFEALDLDYVSLSKRNEY